MQRVERHQVTGNTVETAPGGWGRVGLGMRTCQEDFVTVRERGHEALINHTASCKWAEPIASVCKKKRKGLFLGKALRRGHSVLSGTGYGSWSCGLWFHDELPELGCDGSQTLHQPTIGLSQSLKLSTAKCHGHFHHRASKSKSVTTAVKLQRPDAVAHTHKPNTCKVKSAWYTG